MEVLTGIPASPGIAIGKAFLFQNDPKARRRSITPQEIAEEIRRLEEAVRITKEKLHEIHERLSSTMPSNTASMFQAQMLMLEDPMFLEKVYQEIEESLVNAEWAVMKVGEELAETLSQVEDEYLRERAIDIKDVSRHILANLSGEERLDISSLQEKVIIVAHDLAPSDTALLPKEKVMGFATDMGSRISHTAILARSLEIPAVVALGDISTRITTGQMIILDGNRGKLIIDPDDETIARYEGIRLKFIEHERELSVIRDLPAVTTDGHEVMLSANIEFPEELEALKQYGARGIGLYRTEYFYLRKDTLPTEEELFEDYKNVAQAVSPDPVIIRTLDLGADKFVSYLGVPESMSSMMGLRAIRLCLKYQEIFLPQLRAILRASVYGNVKLMFPLISGIEELRQAKSVLEKAKKELDEKGIPYDHDMEMGVMIEIPAAAITSDILAKEVDFFSIGTNDLIQYTLAVDRGNEEISWMFEPFHPAVLRLIKFVIESAHKNGIWVGLCGEMAADPVFTLILLGLGLDEFSMNPASIPEVKGIIRASSYADARRIAEEALSFSTAWEIEAYIWRTAMQRFPEQLNWVAR
ncbi:TPA: phosphoenolpyruvate--protein phosphotransferase [Candidatus Poribacteria bacterium]|nr:phosphoenolpyruvate--protein phosphotransferase [Candidatus Poribacteria bacterium]